MLVVVLSLTGFAALAASGCGEDETVDSGDTEAISQAADLFLDAFPNATEEQEECVRDTFADFSDETLAELQELGEGKLTRAEVSPQTQQAGADLRACVKP